MAEDPFAKYDIPGITTEPQREEDPFAKYDVPAVSTAPIPVAPKAEEDPFAQYQIPERAKPASAPAPDTASVFRNLAPPARSTADVIPEAVTPSVETQPERSPAGRAVPPSEKKPSLLSRLTRPIRELGKGLASGTESAVLASVGNIIEWLAETGGPSVLPGKPMQRYNRAVLKKFGADKPIVDFGKFVSDFWQDQASKGIEAPSDDVSWAKTPVSMATRGIGEAVPLFSAAIAATVATKSPVAASILFGLTGGTQTYSDARKAGKSISRSEFLGTLSGLWEGASESIPFNKLLGRAGQKAVTRMWKGAVTEGLQEFVQTLGTDLIEKFGFEPERALFTMDKFLSTIIPAFAMGAGGGAAVRTPSATAEARSEAEAAFKDVKAEAKPPLLPPADPTRPEAPIAEPVVRPELAERIAPEAEPTVRPELATAEPAIAPAGLKPPQADMFGFDETGFRLEQQTAPDTFRIQAEKDAAAAARAQADKQQMRLSEQKPEEPVTASGKTKSEVLGLVNQSGVKQELQFFLSELEDIASEINRGRATGRGVARDAEGNVIRGINYGAAYPKGFSKESIPAIKAAINGKMTPKQADTIERALNHLDAKLHSETGESLFPRGVGAAAAAEFAPVKEFTTSNKNATIDAERKTRGQKPIAAVERQTNQAAWDEAMQKIDDDVQTPDVLIKELQTQPRSASPVENAILLHRHIDLRNDYEKALNKWFEAEQRNDETQMLDADKQVERLDAQLNDLDQVLRKVGTIEGRALQARKMEAAEDFSLRRMQVLKQQATGKKLTKEEQSELVAAHKKIADLQGQLDKRLENADAKKLKAAVDQTTIKTAIDARKDQKNAKKGVKQPTKEELIGKIQNKLDKGKKTEMSLLIQKLAKILWLEGHRTQGQLVDALHRELSPMIDGLTKEEVSRAFSGYGEYKTLSKEEVDVGLRDLRGQTQQLLKLAALEARLPLEKTGVERREPSDIERRLIKQVNELKRKLGVVVTDPATQLKSALASRKTYYQHRLADLKYEIETRSKIVKTKTASPMDAELQKLKAEYDAVKAEHAAIFIKPGLTDAQRLSMALSAAQKNQSYWEGRLALAKKGDFAGKQPGKKLTSTEIETIRVQTEAIKSEVAELKSLANPKASPEERALEAAKTRMYSKFLEYQKRRAEGDFETRKRVPIALDKEGLSLEAQLEVEKARFKRAVEADRYKSSSLFGKTKRGITDAYDAARALMTTGEFSVLLRQGKFAWLSHPILSAKAMPNFAKALFSNETKARALDMQTTRDPEAQKAKAAGVALNDLDAPLSRQEELIMGRLVGKIPIVGNIARASHIFINHIRLATWKSMTRTLPATSATPAESAQIAKFINQMTGKGQLGAGERVAVALGRTFFAPRFIMSRLQMATGQSMWGGTARSRAIIGKEYARILIGMSAYYGLLSLITSDEDDKKKTELDPRSSDFGKVRIGNTRIDPLAGLAQVITLGARLGRGSIKTSSGKILPIRGSKVAYGGRRAGEILGSFGRSKLHPIPSAMWNLYDGTDLVGNPADFKTEASRFIKPIAWTDIYQAFRDDGVEHPVALALLAVLGEGLNTYQNKGKSRRRRRSLPKLKPRG